MSYPLFLDIPAAETAEEADVLLLPLPYEGTVTYGKGTGKAPEAIWRATGQVEDWDEEIEFDLFSGRYFSAPAVAPQEGERPEDYLRRVAEAARALHQYKGLVFGVGGEHSITPPLVQAAVEAGPVADPSELTVIQIDAHADLRDQYEETPFSHACAMRRVLDLGASVISIGIRSADRAEALFGRECSRLKTYYAQALMMDPYTEGQLMNDLADLTGAVYLTVDIDGLDGSLCPATGTPQPGGLQWWQAMRYLRQILYENRGAHLVGCDLTEVVPQPGTIINEFTAARLMCKVIGYHLGKVRRQEEFEIE